MPAGGFLVDMASHDYDTMCWILGEEPERVHVERQASVYPELEASDDLDNAVVTVRFDGGGVATTHVSARARGVTTSGSRFSATKAPFCSAPKRHILE